MSWVTTFNRSRIWPAIDHRPGRSSRYAGSVAQWEEFPRTPQPTHIGPRRFNLSIDSTWQDPTMTQTLSGYPLGLGAEMLRMTRRALYLNFADW